MSKEEKEMIIPDQIYDKNNKKSYIKGRYLGKGGFAKCYEIRDSKTHEIFAGKIVPKRIMTKNNQREKMIQEIIIHKSLNHRHIVGFHGSFDDSHNVYIILELCRKRSMMELHKRRKALTEYETRYYMKQILEGVSYLHQNRIIHRDLKLGNVFLNDDLYVKIGDFGLATKIQHDGERKQTLCGTPNYIAPEILTKAGHSYEVDIWSIGCIMYTLLVGKPPFETSSLKETYTKIKQVDYEKPPHMQNTAAMNMISNMLQGSPSKRPSVAKLLKDSFFTSGFMPTSLPVSCLTMAPRLDMLESFNRKPLSEMNFNNSLNIEDIYRVKSSPRKAKQNGQNTAQKADHDIDNMLKTLKEQLEVLLKSKPGKEMACSDEMTDPIAQPFVWVSKWVDYSDKYGFGYQLSDDGVGVMYNDGTRLIMLANNFNIHYINRLGEELYYTIRDYPHHLEKKMKLLNFFLRYMNDHLMKAGGTVAIKQSDSLARPPYMHQWFRTQTAVVMLLTNGSLQINFQDHTKIILCPLMAAVTYIDQEKNFRTYRFKTIEEFGCCPGLAKCLSYAHGKVNLLISKMLSHVAAFPSDK
ncbi:PREDICTED: serine/threonine-protein kinase polo [Ceratosolen solmsi marchali]|uniref:Serine/threonine-protein kinase PLK n=1 Tax=Ceratosolen solmsi marchali TaxID=326594 RepID=A0AAJ6YBI6_9HYME|nr:PREDICTED: serine/threonine-protein kinase polo [Ceratosolen solmsi marchali]